MRLLRSKWWVLLAVLALVAITPITAAAMTNSEVIAVLNAGLTAVRTLVQDAYCASGVTALCP